MPATEQPLEAVDQGGSSSQSPLKNLNIDTIATTTPIVNPDICLGSDQSVPRNPDVQFSSSFSFLEFLHRSPNFIDYNCIMPAENTIYDASYSYQDVGLDILLNK